MDQLAAFELENQRLQTELVRSQEDNSERMRRQRDSARAEEGEGINVVCGIEACTCLSHLLVLTY